MKELLKKLRYPAAAVLTAGLITVLAALGVLDSADGVLSDAMYQQPGATDGEIVIVGMDQRALEALGPMPWPRGYMAEAIRFLNSDPENKPAVIGIDVLYVGAGSDPDADTELIEAAREGGNVVAASAATFGADLVTDGDRFYIDDRAVLAWDSPFPEFAAVIGTGHINAMADTDGYIRHTLYSVEVPEVGRVKSFARVLYEKYAEYHGISLCDEPPLSPDGFFYLPYTADPGAYYEDISFVDLLEGNVDPEEFAGKIVLIRPYAAGMQDEYRTSIDHAAPMYGIEIQANQIDAYRSGFLPKEVPEGLQLVLLFLVSAAAMLWFRNRRMLLATPVWVGFCALWGGCCFALYRTYGMDHARAVAPACRNASVYRHDGRKLRDRAPRKAPRHSDLRTVRRSGDP